MNNIDHFKKIGKIGGKQSAIISHKKRRSNIKLYNLNPKLCKKCNSIIPYDKRRNNFCSHSCSASFNNLGHRRHGNPEIRKNKMKLYMKSEIYKTKRRDSTNKRNKKKREFLLSHFGTECAICKTKNRLEIHNINGIPHKDFYTMSWKKIKNITLNQKNEYKSVCHICHNHIHWCMKSLGLNWGEIYNFARSSRVGNIGGHT